jgi:hypothetical protein
MRPVLVAAFVVVVLSSFALGCSDDDKPKAKAADPLQQIQEATFAGSSAAYNGQTTFADGSTAPIDGVSQADPPAGEVRYPVQTARGPQEVTARWLDGSLYVQRAVTDDPDVVSPTLRLETDPPWTQAIYQPLARAGFDAYDPFRLLERLTLLDVDATAEGSEAVDGDQLDRFVVDLADLPVTPANANQIELLTDDDQRLRVVRLEGDDRIEYTIDEYGVAVTPVAPPADQIGASASRPSVEPTGPFEQVAQGTAPETGDWQLWRAPGTDGGTCWRLDVAVPLDPVAATQPDGTTCIAAVDPTSSADEQVQVVVDAGAGAPFDLVVATVPPGSSSARIRLADGTAHPLTIDPAGFAIWIGPERPVAVVLDVAAPSGEVVTCAPGAVTEFDDLESLTREAIEQLDRQPWLCLAL